MTRVQVLAAVAGLVAAGGAAKAYPPFPPAVPGYPTPGFGAGYYPPYGGYPPPAGPGFYPRPYNPVVAQSPTAYVPNAYGGVDTYKRQVKASAYAYGRDESRSNGTLRPVSRPTFDAYGTMTGWKRGVEWYNSYTGQRHFDGTVRKPNGLGGVASTATTFSTESLAARRAP